jgi:hypothetical protein
MTRASGSPPVSASSLIAWGTPSSVTVKSDACRVKTGSPFRVVTRAGIRTMVVLALNMVG